MNVQSIMSHSYKCFRENTSGKKNRENWMGVLLKQLVREGPTKLTLKKDCRK